MNNYTKQLTSDLEEKSIAPSTIKLYIRNMEILNNNTELKNINFLNDVDEIIRKLSKYKDNTKRTYLISICSVLSTIPTKKKLYKKYFDLLKEMNINLKKKESENKINDVQEKNWITWENVKEKYNELLEEVNGFKNSKEINENKYKILLKFIILSLYVLTKPRRNQDYALMNIIKKYNANDEANKNYLDLTKKQFIFNVYKTAKTKGEKIKDIPEELFENILIYLKYHPLLKNKKISNNTNIPFLVYHSGETFNKTNDITNILNKIFKKKIGTSMLRHIYLSSKYGDILKEQKEDADDMGHSIQMQKDYIKI
jgi:hypothetical protein